MAAHRADADQGAPGGDEGEREEVEEADSEHAPVPPGGEGHREPQARLCGGGAVPGRAAAGTDAGAAGRFLWRRVRELLCRPYGEQGDRQREQAPAGRLDEEAEEVAWADGRTLCRRPTCMPAIAGWPCPVPGIRQVSRQDGAT